MIYSHFKKKRLRKKYFQKEFAEYGVDIEIKWVDPYKNTEYFDKVIDTIVKNDLQCGGGSCPRSIILAVCASKPYKSVTLEQVSNLKKDLEELNIGEVIIKDFIDAWYPDRTHNYKG